MSSALQGCLIGCIQRCTHILIVYCTGDALEMLQRCIEQSPELLELYTLQCKILAHAGDLAGAAAAADKARSMDLADRYIVFSLGCTHAAMQVVSVAHPTFIYHPEYSCWLLGDIQTLSNYMDLVWCCIVAWYQGFMCSIRLVVCCFADAIFQDSITVIRTVAKQHRGRAGHSRRSIDGSQSGCSAGLSSKAALVGSARDW